MRQLRHPECLWHDSIWNATSARVTHVQMIGRQGAFWLRLARAWSRVHEWGQQQGVRFDLVVVDWLEISGDDTHMHHKRFRRAVISSHCLPLCFYGNGLEILKLQMQCPETLSTFKSIHTTCTILLHGPRSSYYNLGLKA